MDDPTRTETTCLLLSSLAALTSLSGALPLVWWNLRSGHGRELYGCFNEGLGRASDAGSRRLRDGAVSVGCGSDWQSACKAAPGLRIPRLVQNLILA